MRIRPRCFILATPDTPMAVTLRRWACRPPAYVPFIEAMHCSCALVKESM